MNTTRTLVRREAGRHPIQVAVLAILVILVVLSSLLPPQILRIIIDQQLSKKISGNLLFLAIIYVVAVLLGALLDFLKTAMGSDIATMDSTVFILCKGATSTTLIKMVFGLKTEPQSAHMTLPQKGLHPYVNPSCSHCPAGPGRHRTVLL